MEALYPWVHFTNQEQYSELHPPFGLVVNLAAGGLEGDVGLVALP
ncbi:MAG: hypothetical protein ABR609_13695 [Acidimicrobiia bacterium]